MAIRVQIPARNALQQNSCKSVLSVVKIEKRTQNFASLHSHTHIRVFLRKLPCNYPLIYLWIIYGHLCLKIYSDARPCVSTINSCKFVLFVFKKMYSDARSVSPTKFHFSTAK